MVCSENTAAGLSSIITQQLCNIQYTVKLSLAANELQTPTRKLKKKMRRKAKIGHKLNKSKSACNPQIKWAPIINYPITSSQQGLQIGRRGPGTVEGHREQLVELEPADWASLDFCSVEDQQT